MNATLNAIYQHIDAFLIFFFRLTDIAMLGYFIGCAVLCLICVVLGQLTIAVAFRFNRRFIDSDNQQVIRMHNLSMKALAAKDKPAFKSCNKQANEAFGKLFFSQIALSAASLWPIPFAAGWMQTRFLNVQFHLPVSLPWIGDQVGYMFTFLPVYVLVYILFGKIKSRLPFFRSMAKILKQYNHRCGERIISISDLASSASDRSGNRA
jgi:hypothetical protein